LLVGGVFRKIGEMVLQIVVLQTFDEYVTSAGRAESIFAKLPA
jgi:hypothetical protein